MDDRSRRIKIILALIVSFFLSRIVLDGVFVSKTPKIQANLIGRYITAISHTTSNLVKSMSSFQIFHNPGWTTISRGIYTKTEQSTISIMVREQEVDWTEYPFNIKGQTIIVKVPKGENPPPQSFIEQMY